MELGEYPRLTFESKLSRLRLHEKTRPPHLGSPAYPQR